MLVKRKCIFDGKEYIREVNVTPEQISAWENGMLIQNAMPNVSKDDREFLMTGTTPEVWKELFGAPE